MVTRGTRSSAAKSAPKATSPPPLPTPPKKGWKKSLPRSDSAENAKPTKKVKKTESNLSAKSDTPLAKT